MKREHNFRAKIECIYEHICNKDIYKLTELFLNDTDISNRKIHIERKWLVKDLTPRLFKKEYNNYNFSKLTLNDKRLFRDATEFLEIGLDEFCKRVKEYAHHSSLQKFKSFNTYPYLYMPNYINNEFFIDYYKLTYKDRLEPSKISLEAIPPQKKSHLNISKYGGICIVKDDFYILRLENDSDYLIAIFNTNNINKNINYIVGLAIGVADTNKKNVIAKKAIISKKRFSDDELKEIYLTLNESEVLDTKENLFYLEDSNNNLNLMHLKKYNNKIDRFRALFCNLIDKYPFFQQFYYQTALNRFIDVSEVLERSTNNRSYFIADIIDILLNLLNSNSVEKFNFLKIVMPYNQNNLFTFHSNKATKIRDTLLKLAKDIKIEIIFVLIKCKNSFEKRFLDFLQIAYNSGISINFANFEDIQSNVNSIDFIITNKNSFVIAKNLRSEQNLYSVYTSDILYDDYQSIFNKILNSSISFKSFKENNWSYCKSRNEILDMLVGSWHLYIFGSQKFWSDILKINQDNRVELISEDKITDIGTILIKKKQALVILEDIYNDNLLTITFDIHSKDRLLNAFVASVVAKKFGYDDDLLSFAIISKYPIKEEIAKEILGNRDKTVLSNEDIKDRLNKYIVSKFGYYKDR